MTPIFNQTEPPAGDKATVDWRDARRSNSACLHDQLRHTMEYVATDSLLLPDLLIRDYSEDLVDRYADHASAFGNIVPIVINADRRIVIGYPWWEAAKRAGLAMVPVIQITHLSASEQNLFALGHEKLGELADWNQHNVGAIFFELAKQDLPYDLTITGFQWGEIDGLIDLSNGSGDYVEDDALPEPASQAVAGPGDVFACGAHRVICADALQQESFEKLLTGEKAKLVFTDPPYNVRIDGHVGGKGRVKHREFLMASGEMSTPRFKEMLTASTALLARFTTDGGINLICMDWRHIADLIEAGRPSYSQLLNLIVWVKTNAGMGSHYRSQHELIAMFKVGKGKVQNNVQLGKHRRNRTNVWTYPGMSSNTKERDGLLATHPTVKPVALVAEAILDSTKRGDIVLDAFGGSGTTLIAAAKTGRVARLIELDPIYVDAIIMRWQTWSGEQAIHHETGLTFDELRDKRAAIALTAAIAEENDARNSDDATASPPMLKPRVRTRIRPAAISQ